MLKATADGFRWSADADGMWLSIRTTHPQDIIETVKDGKTYDIEIREHREKRSLDANALYWVLLTAFAKALCISNNRAHNIMLRRYGVPEAFGESVVYIVLPDTTEAEEKALEAETVHMRPTSQTKEGRDGIRYRTYLLLKGSSDFDTAEMTRLINGLIEECKDADVDTTSPYERSLIEDWEKHHGSK